MSHNLILAFVALLTLVPAGIALFHGPSTRGHAFWAIAGLAFLGPLAQVVAQLSGNWSGDFSTTLWVIIASTMWVFLLLSAATRQVWRLLPLLGPYMLMMGVLATMWLGLAEQPLSPAAPRLWVVSHIAVSVLTFALLTMAALAAVGAFFQERALKRKKPTRLTRQLPSVADCERIEVMALLAGEAILALGLITGMGTLYAETGRLLALDHKILLSFAAFVVIGGLLVAHFWIGTRGRLAARLVLEGYLLLALGYPGVKFVSEVLLA